jgi:hypothetical protein
MPARALWREGQVAAILPDLLPRRNKIIVCRRTGSSTAWHTTPARFAPGESITLEVEFPGQPEVEIKHVPFLGTPYDLVQILTQAHSCLKQWQVRRAPFLCIMVCFAEQTKLPFGEVGTLPGKASAATS